MGTSEPTPEQRANLELARGGLVDWIAGNREAAIATFTEDVEVFVPPELGNAGTFTGVEQFRSWFAAWDEAWSEFDMEILEIESVGESHVVAMIQTRGVGAGSGIEVGNTLAWVLGIRGGKMAYLSLQPDKEHADALVREREAG